MYIIRQLKNSLINTILLSGIEGGGSGMDITDSIDGADIKVLNDFKGNLTPEQQSKFDVFYNNLNKTKQEELLVVLPKIGNNVEQFLNHIETISSKESKEKNTNLFDAQRENFSGNEKMLAKIYEIEEEINEKLLPYVEYNSNYTKLFQDVLETRGNPEDSEYKELNAFLIQKIHTVEMMKERIGNLEIELKILEGNGEKEKRYEGLDKSFDKIKTDDKLKDIIGEKDFNKLSSGDIYAMLKSNPEKMSGLLLSTSDGNQIDLSNGWKSYEGIELKVNFGKNKSLDKIIGAGDILDINDVKKVKINGIEGERKSSPRPGYYTPNGRYLAIHDGYKVEITNSTKLTGEAEIKEFNDAKNKRFEEIRGGEVSETISLLIDKAVKDNPNSKQIENPYKSDVDKALIKNILAKEENKYLGVTLNEDGNIVVGDNFNISHLSEALTGYSKTQNKVIEYLQKNKDLGNDKNIDFNISKLGLDGNKEFLENAFKNIVGNEKVKISINVESVIIDSSNTELTISNIFSSGYEYEGNGTGHEKYMSQINDAARKYGVPSGAIIQLIYHENRSWNPNIKAPGSSAYGLGQMINSTWNTYGEGDRNNPADQLMATAKYMKNIKENKNCKWEEVLAYYNTGEGIMSGRVDINNYYNLNPAITNKIPGGIGRSNKNYFTGAVAYYNDISFESAKLKVTV